MLHAQCRLQPQAYMQTPANASLVVFGVQAQRGACLGRLCPHMRNQQRPSSNINQTTFNVKVERVLGQATRETK